MAIFKSCSPTCLSDPFTFLTIRSRMSPINLPRLSFLISSDCIAPANHSWATISAKSSKSWSSISSGNLNPCALAATRVSACVFSLDQPNLIFLILDYHMVLPRMPFADGWLSRDTSGTYALILSETLASFGAHCSATVLLNSFVNRRNFLQDGFGNILSSRGSLIIDGQWLRSPIPLQLYRHTWFWFSIGTFRPAFQVDISLQRPIVEQTLVYDYSRYFSGRKIYHPILPVEIWVWYWKVIVR